MKNYIKYAENILDLCSSCAYYRYCLQTEDSVSEPALPGGDSSRKSADSLTGLPVAHIDNLISALPSGLRGYKLPGCPAADRA